MRKIRQDVRSRRGADKQVAGIRKLDVPGLPRLLFVIKGDEHRTPGKRLHGEGRDEFSGVAGHHDIDGVAEFDKLRCDFARFESCDGAGDAKKDFFCFHVAG